MVSFGFKKTLRGAGLSRKQIYSSGTAFFPSCHPASKDLEFYSHFRE